MPTTYTLIVSNVDRNRERKRRIRAYVFKSKQPSRSSFFREKAHTKICTLIIQKKERFFILNVTLSRVKGLTDSISELKVFVHLISSKKKYCFSVGYRNFLLLFLFLFLRILNSDMHSFKCSSVNERKEIFE